MRKILFLLLLALPLYASEFSKPQTTYSDEDGYFTQGYVTFSAPKEKTDSIFWDYKGYEEWLLEGLTREDPEARKLTVTLNRLLYHPEDDTFQVFFSFNIWFLRNRDYSLYFRLIRLDGEESTLTVDLVESSLSRKFIEKLTYTLTLEHSPDSDSIRYTGSCALKGFAARCFNLRLYKKNIEWYIYTFARNFIRRVSP